MTVQFRLLAGIVLLAGCGQPPVPPPPPAQVARVAPPEPDETATDPMPELEKGPFAELEGGWVLHRVWAGTMGVAINFKRDGTFDYWFYSDARSEHEPKYPITGKWKWNGNVLELEAEQHLYANRWYACRHRGERALLPEHARQWQLKDGKPHTDRLLFHVPKFDPTQPFLTDLPHLERPKEKE